MSLQIPPSFKRKRFDDLNSDMEMCWIRMGRDSLLASRTKKSTVWIRLRRRKIDNENDSLVSMYKNERYDCWSNENLINAIGLTSTSPERKRNIKTNNHLILFQERLKSLRIWYLPSQIDQSNVGEAVSDRMAFAPMLTYHESITGTDCSRHYFLLASRIFGASIEKYIEMCWCVCVYRDICWLSNVDFFVCLPISEN